MPSVHPTLTASSSPQKNLRRIVAVKIRLKRMGKIRAPYYRIVVVDGRAKRDGRSIEEIGKYHPTEEPSFIEVDSERAQYWLGVGAQPTEQVTALLKLTGDWGIFKGDKATSVSTVRTKATKDEFTADEKKKPVLKPKAEAPAPKAAVAEPVEAPAAEATPADDDAAAATGDDVAAEAAVEAPTEEASSEAAEEAVVEEAEAAADADATEEIAASEAAEGDK
ncbi:MAG: ribosomal protein [Microbacteriaceae bacterium]|jgi:small subunit ribosomal protein S16|nr:ribosomal protein [Microbacteriaceae bacterium]